jgi:hypothetical protein
MIFVTRMMQHSGLMAIIGMILLFCMPHSGSAQNAESTQTTPKKTFHAVVTDAKGVETDVQNIHFYWEEKLSETAFVPNELREVPVTRGTATVKVKFETIKQIDIRQGSNGGLPVLAITLTNGKSGEFTLAIDGTFRGESDFGEVEFQPTGLSKIIFK